MKASRKFLSLPIVSLSEGQHIGYVKNLIIDADKKCIAALVVDPKGFFKDQRIIPYSKVISVGEDAITIDKSSQVEKSTNIPEILDLIKQKLTINGTKIVTETGKTLGFAEEYFVEPSNGKIIKIEISGGKLEGILNGKAMLDANQVITVGHDVIVAQKGSESSLEVAGKGLNDSLKSFWHSTSHVATEKTNSLGNYLKKIRKDNPADDSMELAANPAADPDIEIQTEQVKAIEQKDSTESHPSPTEVAMEDAQTSTQPESQSPSTKEPLG